MKTTRKVALTIIIIALVLLAAVMLLAGPVLCNYVVKPQWHGQDLDYTMEYMDEEYGLGDWFKSLQDEGSIKDTVIVGEHGVNIHAAYFAAADPENAPGTAFIIHGYTCNYRYMLHIARMYREDLGYNVFMPDLQHHGLSEGEAIQMGWLDRLDVIRWIDVARDVFHDDFMVIHGISMGGATTMMVSGEALPPFVRAFVDDCGYTDVWAELKYKFRQEFKLPSWPFLDLADRYCQKHYGWGFKEASSTAQLAKSTGPMLFIHGDSDDYVPTAHVYGCFEAKTHGYKELWLAPDTGHADSYKNHPDEYRDKVAAFLAKVKENY